MQKSRFYQPSHFERMHGGTFAVSFPTNITIFCVRVYLRVTLPLHIITGFFPINLIPFKYITEYRQRKKTVSFVPRPKKKLVLPQFISETVAVAATDLLPPLSILSPSRVLLLIPASYFNICLSFLSYLLILIALP